MLISKCKFILSIAVFVCACVASPGSSVAMVINVDFGGGTLFTGTGADPDTGTVWNDFDGAAVTGAALVDSTGAATGITLTKNATSAFEDAVGGAITSSNLMSDYLHNDNNDATVGNISFNGLIPGGAYDLYLYAHGDQVDQFTEFTIDPLNGGAVLNTTGGSRLTLTNPVNYVTVSLLADATGQIAYTWGEDLDDANNAHAAHNGIQLVESAANNTIVPEPHAIALWSLLGMIGTGYSVFRRKRQA